MADEAPVAATAGDESKQAHPDSMAEITTEWLTTVLAGHVGRKVTSFDCHAVGQGDEIAGFASDTARVTAVLEPLAEGAAAKFAGDTVDLYAKFRYTTDDEKRPAAVAAFAREVAFYNNLRDDVHPVIPVARCVVAAPSVILLFDEVKPFKGVRRVGDQLKGCSREEASLVVRHLAALHAKFWKSPVLNEGYVVERSVKAMFGNPASWQPIAGAVSQGVAMFKKLLAAGEDGAAPIVESQVPPQAFDDYAYIASRLADVIPAVLPHVKTLLHNDVRLDNMVLGDGELVMLDWQAYTSGWVMADLVQLIVFNLNHESCLAKDVERELLEEYRLALVGSEGFPEEDAAGLTADELYQQYRLAVGFLAVGDCMAWGEQFRAYEAGKRGDDMYPSSRMRELAPSISSNMAQCVIRNNSRAAVEALPVFKAEPAAEAGEAAAPSEPAA